MMGVGARIFQLLNNKIISAKIGNLLPLRRYSDAAKLAAKNIRPNTIIKYPTIPQTNIATGTPSSAMKTPPLLACDLAEPPFCNLNEFPITVSLLNS